MQLSNKRARKRKLESIWVCLSRLLSGKFVSQAVSLCFRRIKGTEVPRRSSEGCGGYVGPGSSHIPSAHQNEGSVRVGAILSAAPKPEVTHSKCSTYLLNWLFPFSLHNVQLLTVAYSSLQPISAMFFSTGTQKSYSLRSDRDF